MDGAYNGDIKTDVSFGKAVADEIGLVREKSFNLIKRLKDFHDGGLVRRGG